jgi:hypothetical protein
MSVASLGAASVLLNVVSILSSGRPVLVLAVSLAAGVGPGVAIGYVLARHVSLEGV